MDQAGYLKSLLIEAMSFFDNKGRIQWERKLDNVADKEINQEESDGVLDLILERINKRENRVKKPYNTYLVIFGDGSASIVGDLFENREGVVPDARQVINDDKVQDQVNEARNKSELATKYIVIIYMSNKLAQ